VVGVTRTCDDCGDALTEADRNPGGRYRDRCRACIEEAAASIGSHVDDCDREDCSVCRDHREEFGTKRP